jgi:hypothetical protein
LRRSFGDDLDAVRDAMERLAASVSSDVLAESAFSLYERFRPAVARGQRGWGQKGALDLDRIRTAASRSPAAPDETAGRSRPKR